MWEGGFFSSGGGALKYCRQTLGSAPPPFPTPLAMHDEGIASSLNNIEKKASQ